MDDSFSEYNDETLSFLNNSKSQFEELKEKYFGDKQEITQITKEETEVLYPEIEAEKANINPEFKRNSD
jgi:hypothetical protein